MLCPSREKSALLCRPTCIQVLVEAFLQGRHGQRWQHGLVLKRSLSHGFKRLIVHYYLFNAEITLQSDRLKCGILTYLVITLPTVPLNTTQ